MEQFASARVLRRLIVSAALVAVVGCSGGSRQERRADQRTAPATSSPPQVPSNADKGTALRVTVYGIGPIRAGMSVAEASSVLGAALQVPEGVDAAGCNYVRWPGGPEGVSVMIEHLVIARVDVRSGAIATEEGARIGDPAERIRRLYTGRVTSSPHKYTGGEYLTVATESPADGAFRLVFETEAGTVTRYRSGKLPQVQYVEGCS